MNAGAHPPRSAVRNYFSFPVIGHQNPWLDFIRSLAIIFVLLHHGQQFFPIAQDGMISRLIANFLTNGWVGVDLFLVLSGYLIANSLLRSYHADAPIKAGKYFRSRIFRILPAYYVVLFLVVAGAFPYHALRMDVTFYGIFYHVLFLQDYLPPRFSVTFWSLGVEEKFYILAPILLMILLQVKKARTGLFLLGALLLISPVSKTIGLYTYPGDMTYSEFWNTLRRPFHQVLEPLIVGVALSFIERHKLIELTDRQARIVMASASAFLLVLMLSHDFYSDLNFFDVAPQPLLHAALFGALVLAANRMPAGALRGTAVWRPLARLSYAIYLVHYPLLSLCVVLAKTTTLPYISFWIIYLIISTGAALLLHFIVEKPFLMLKDGHWSLRRQKKISAAA